MTRFQALLITASFSVPLVVGLFILVLNYFDNRAAAKQVKQKQAHAPRQTADSALAPSELSEAEREQLKSHIEALEAFAKAVRNASAAVDESLRHAHTTAAAQRTLESEKQ
ncbi:MAG TPA: hypothetical protein VN838_17590 [Bradyrhizobium sp.]|nr:hypothetical protein [Bradyrhizobium sp.]